MAKKAKKAKKQSKKQAKTSPKKAVKGAPKKAGKAAKKTAAKKAGAKKKTGSPKKNAPKKAASKKAASKKAAKTSARNSSAKKAPAKKTSAKTTAKKTSGGRAAPVRKAVRAPARKRGNTPYRPPVATSKTAKKALASTAIGAAVPAPAIEIKEKAPKVAKPRKPRAPKPASVVEMPSDASSHAVTLTADESDGDAAHDNGHGGSPHAESDESSDARQPEQDAEEQPRDLFEHTPSQEEGDEAKPSDQDDMR